jgi:hypothetical protein
MHITEAGSAPEADRQPVGLRSGLRTAQARPNRPDQEAGLSESRYAIYAMIRVTTVAVRFIATTTPARTKATEILGRSN